MNTQEYLRAQSALVVELSPCGTREEWVREGREAEYERRCNHAAVRAAEAVLRARVALDDPEHDAVAPPAVVLPAPLARATREISCAPAVHILLALLEAGVAPIFAHEVVGAVDDLQMEDDEEEGYFQWGWTHWETSSERMRWVTCTGQTSITLTATGATLTRREGGRLTGQWTWGPDHELYDGWGLEGEDWRAPRLLEILGAKSGTSPEIAREGEERELAALKGAAAEREEREQAIYRRSLRRRARGARGNRRRDKARRAARAHKERRTWDQPVA